MRLYSWNRDPRNAHHDPRLLGTVDPWQMSVARYPDAAGRNSFAPWLSVRSEAAGDGGTTLTGTIGLHSGVRAGLVVMAIGRGCDRLEHPKAPAIEDGRASAEAGPG